jgi:hypothetical protein
MTISLTKKEINSIHNAIDQLDSIIEGGAEGIARETLIEDSNNLKKIIKKIKNAKNT